MWAHSGLLTDLGPASRLFLNGSYAAADRCLIVAPQVNSSPPPPPPPFPLPLLEGHWSQLADGVELCLNFVLLRYNLLQQKETNILDYSVQSLLVIKVKCDVWFHSVDWSLRVVRYVQLSVFSKFFSSVFIIECFFKVVINWFHSLWTPSLSQFSIGDQMCWLLCRISDFILTMKCYNFRKDLKMVFYNAYKV